MEDDAWSGIELPSQGMEIIIYPPEGNEFSICTQCKNICIKDKSCICLWCTLNNMDEKDLNDGK